MTQVNAFGLSLRTIAAAAALSFGAAPALAGQATATLSVTATVGDSCSVGLSPVAFGRVEPGAATAATGNLVVACTSGTAWTATADRGSGAGASVADRRLSSGESQLSYALYADSARTALWGDGSASTMTIGDSGTGAAQSFPIHGEIGPDQLDARPGFYSDVVTVTIAY